MLTSSWRTFKSRYQKGDQMCDPASPACESQNRGIWFYGNARSLMVVLRPAGVSWVPSAGHLYKGSYSYVSPKITVWWRFCDIFRKSGSLAIKCLTCRALSCIRNNFSTWQHSRISLWHSSGSTFHPSRFLRSKYGTIWVIPLSDFKIGTIVSDFSRMGHLRVVQWIWWFPQQLGSELNHVVMFVYSLYFNFLWWLFITVDSCWLIFFDWVETASPPLTRPLARRWLKINA